MEGFPAGRGKTLGEQLRYLRCGIPGVSNGDLALGFRLQKENLGVNYDSIQIKQLLP